MQNVKSFGKKLAVAIPAGMAASAAFAADHSATISAAAADGQTNVGAAVTAVIGIAAVVVGVGVVLSLLRR